jgi:hypothetical protein
LKKLMLVAAALFVSRLSMFAGNRRLRRDGWPQVGAQR